MGGIYISTKTFKFRLMFVVLVEMKLAVVENGGLCKNCTATGRKNSKRVTDCGTYEAVDFDCLGQY